MGDLLRILRVAPLLLSFQLVNHVFAADAFTFAWVTGFRSPARGLRGTADAPGSGEMAGEGMNFAAAESVQARGARVKRICSAHADGCDHTSTNAPNPIITRS